MAYPDVILAADPLIYWRMDDISLSVLSDSSGNARHYTYGGGNKPDLNIPGAFPGQVARFFRNSPANYSTSDAILRSGAAWTVEWFTRLDDAFNDSVWALAQTSTAAGDYVRLENTWRDRTLRVWTGAEELLAAQSAPLPFPLSPDPDYHHWALRHDSGTLDIFLDGVLADSVSRTISIPSGGNLQFRFGTGWGSSELSSIRNLFADVDEVAVFDYALDDALIAYHAVAYDGVSHDVTADAIVVTDHALLTNKGNWLGGQRTMFLGEDGQFKTWLGGFGRVILPGANAIGTTETITADAFIPLETYVDAWLVTEIPVNVTADALLVQVDASLRADAYLVTETGRAFPLPPTGRATPIIPSDREAPRIPGS